MILCLALSRLWRSLWALSKVESSVRAGFAFRGLSCREASVTIIIIIIVIIITIIIIIITIAIIITLKNLYLTLVT